jgi:hypothetical protein
MDYHTVQQLIESYFQGETSLQEEARLRQYFSQPEIDERLRPYQPLFRFLETEQERTTSSSFDEQWTAPPQARIRRLRAPRLGWYVNIAAMLVLAIGLWFLLPSPTGVQEAPVATAIDWSKYEPASEAEALQMTRQALVGAATTLSTGARQALQQATRVKTLADPTR